MNDTPSLPSAASPAWPAPPGYEILGELGRGGMGVVYKARHLAMNREVAIKVMLRSAASDAEMLDRFRREAVALARLEHANIVAVHEVGEHAGSPFLVMEFCPGGTLAQRLERGPLAPREAARLVAVLARAMQAAHDAGILHRDLKPGNILLGQVESSNDAPAAGAALDSAKISDFGLARLVDVPADLTRTGVVVGTPGYMAPEQIHSSQGCDERCDVWALGVILYECLTRLPPFGTPTPLETFHKVLEEDPTPPRQVQPGVPRDVEIITLKCLNKNPFRRYATGRDLADDLERWLDGRPITARSAPAWEVAWKWTRRHPARALAGLAAAVLLLVAAAWVWHDRTQQRLYTDRIEEEAFRAQQAERDAQAKARLARDQQQQAEAQAIRLTVASVQRRLDAGELLAALPEAREALRRAAENELPTEAHRRRIHTTWQLSPTQVAHWPHSESGAKTTDRTIIRLQFDRAGRRLLTAGRDGTARLWEFPEGRPATGPLQHGAPLVHAALGPDGRRIATGGEDLHVRLWDVASGKLVGAPRKMDKPITYFAFYPPPARRLLAAVGHAYERPYQRSLPGNRARVTQSPEAEGIVFDADSGQPLRMGMSVDGWINHVAFRRDGALLALAAADEQGLNPVQLVQPSDGKQKGHELEHEEHVQHTDFSPDGRLLACACGDLTGNTGAVHLWDVATGKPDGQPLRTGAAALRVRFSPDGRRLLTVTGTHTVQVWDAATRQPIGPAWRHGNRVVSASFRADGRQVLTASWDGTATVREILTERPVGSVLPHPDRVTAAVFHPDGQFVVTACADGEVRVWDLARPADARPILRHDRMFRRHTYPVTEMHTLGDDDDEPRITGNRTDLGNLTTTGVHVSPNGRWMLTGLGNNFHETVTGGPAVYSNFYRETMYLCLWDPRTGRPLVEPLRHDLAVTDRLMNADGGQVLHALSEGTEAGVGLWQTAPPRAVVLRKPEKGERIVDTGFFGDAPRAVLTGVRTVRKDGRALQAAYTRVLAIDTGKAVGTELRHLGPLEDARLLGDGSRLAGLVLRPERKGTQRTWAWDLYLWDLARPASPVRVELPRPATRLLASPDGRWLAAWMPIRSRSILATLATAGKDLSRTVLLCDAASGGSTVLTHPGAIRHVVFSPDGGLVAICGERQVWVWTCAGGVRQLSLEHQAGVVCAAFGPKGLLATGCDDGTAHVWDLDRQERLTPPLPHSAAVIALAFHGDGVLATGCQDGTARTWNLAPPAGTALEGPMDATQRRALALVWRREQAESARAAGDATALALHLRHVVAMEPDDHRARQRLADALALGGDWASTAEHYRRLVRQKDATLTQRAVLALLARWRNDAAEAGRLCADMRKAVETASDDQGAALLAWTWALTTDDPTGEPLAWMRRVGIDRKPEHAAVVAAVLLRGGTCAEARQRLREALRLRGAVYRSRLLAALDRTQRGRLAEADALLAQVSPGPEPLPPANPLWRRSRSRVPDPRTTLPTWVSDLEKRLLRREIDRWRQE